MSESTMMSENRRALNTMGELSELGVTLSIDNFGTGDASLAYLKNLPADEVKIDKTFVTSMGSQRGNPAFIRSIIYLAKALELAVVAEGVETEVAAARLADLGCETAQGYYFARPLAKLAFGDWLVAHRGAYALTA
jgi:EAL domain-containing protein (putative c-di-GMP-specific phosphodiesterase class I)